MNGEDDTAALEAELREMTLRRPPAEWKQLLLAPVALPPVPVPWLPKPFVIFLAGCWLATGGFWLATPENDPIEVPHPRPPSAVEAGDFLLGYNPPGDLLE